MAIIDSFKRSQELASLPHIAQKVLKMMQDKKSNIQEVAKVIEVDPVLSMKLLRVANSPIFAVRSKITSIYNALQLLGTKRISNIVLSVSIYSKFFMNNHKQAAVLMERFFNHSYLTGNAAKSLASYLNFKFEDYEFIGGLLHEIGKMAMLQVHPREYSLVQKLIREERLHDLEAEKEVFGENHVEVGIQVAQLWQLPEEVLMIIAFHRNPSVTEDHRDLVSIINFCSIYTKVRANRLFTLGSNEEPFNFDPIEGWRVLLKLHPDYKDLNQSELMKELDYTIKVAPEAITNFK